MRRKLSLTIVCFFIAVFCHAQQGKTPLAIDTSFTDYDALFSELDALIDSITAPRSFTVFNVGFGQNFLTYENKARTMADTKRNFVYAPSLGYYDKSGFGVTAGASVVNDGAGVNPYQFFVAGSYDYLQNKTFVAGVSLAHYFTKGDLPFYISPLQNEAYGYFTYRKLWFRPSVGLSYGWGNRDDFEESEERIQNINLARNGFTRINTRESVIDLNLITSVRHDFYWLNILSRNDYVRITPQVSFISGTQQFGFNQVSNTYVATRSTGSYALYNTENLSFDNQLYFQPLSVTTYLKTEYAKGKFFIQPQLIFDYYFPASTSNFTTAFVVNTGFIF